MTSHNLVSLIDYLSSPLRRFAASPQGDHALEPAKPDPWRVLGLRLAKPFADAGGALAIQTTAAMNDALALDPDDRWRQTHLGRLMGLALRRFDARVLHLMAHDPNVPLALSNLAARDQIGAAHVHITRHLGVQGSRLTELAQAAGMSKQAMGHLVDQCEAWDLVRREPDPHDARARRVVFTATGLLWLDAFRKAVMQAEQEFRGLIGNDVATVVALGLEAYGAQ